MVFVLKCKECWRATRWSCWKYSRFPVIHCNRAWKHFSEQHKDTYVHCSCNYILELHSSDLGTCRYCSTNPLTLLPIFKLPFPLLSDHIHFEELRRPCTPLLMHVIIVHTKKHVGFWVLKAPLSVQNSAGFIRRGLLRNPWVSVDLRPLSPGPRKVEETGWWISQA